MAGKYDPLREYLAALQGDEVTFTFAEIEAILEVALPATAWQRTAWWANSRRLDHPQSRAWMAGGWTVSADVNNTCVTFIRRDEQAASERRGYHWHSPRPTQYTTKISIALPRELKHAIDDAAVDLNLTTSDLVRRVLAEWLEKYEKSGARPRRRDRSSRTYRRRVTIGDS